MDNAGGIIPGVFPGQGANHALAKIALRIAGGDSRLDGFLQAALDINLLPQLHKGYRHARVLAAGPHGLPGQPGVLQQLLQYRPGMALLPLLGPHQGLHHRVGQHATGFDAGRPHGLGDVAC